ncbi:LPS export ABC transporter ATP-binding protein [Candidatus Blochmannia vicinus]|uniref:Lipopolysaccharide export system ATP-binding protein LptB n=1 Tax=Candidatus Blochmannia vicinus (nom. nud.) TaxID=251540 RepID=A0A9Q8TVP7_9ENTR|nr:LPS export ABC transporter ATP-binding protein [Candidatus Blochmannia vicinus]URJ28124.1 LPS export ABC transporter ATP-binding protein [Candidatus Blochmannia vicinus]URJ30601.1 LPS export ABC transporter ATP-binding protein [Candidatus Blochmannia vicinus]URJ32747.1 LPS export ABC transporter ATP-binding protein [Candidatus Blochmannia vicinus]
MTTLIIRNLSKIYKGRYVVNDINLYISSGEIVGLLGPNGSGKTTTFYMILGIVQHNTGHIFLGKKDISIFPIYLRARLGIGYLPQESSIFRRLTVFDNLMAILQTQRNLNTTKRNKLIVELMNNFHISHLRDNIGQTLSGGERKRVEIARALAANPKFMLLDEPFSGVDPIAIIDIQKTIKQLQSRRLGVLITDHNVRETLRICKRAYILNQGKLIAHGSPNEILNNKNVQQVYLGDTIKL